MDVDHEPGFIGELLQFDFPQPDARAVRTAAIRRDRQNSCLWVSAVVPCLQGTDRVLCAAETEEFVQI